jgi:hypothetical protein
MSKQLIQWIASEGIFHQTSTAKPPEKNGVAERYNRTILYLHQVHTFGFFFNKRFEYFDKLLLS